MGDIRWHPFIFAMGYLTQVYTRYKFIICWQTATQSQYRSHYCDVLMGVVASQITSLTIVYSTVHSDADQRKHQSSASLAFVKGIHRGPVDSLRKGPVTRKMIPFDVIMSVIWYKSIRKIVSLFVGRRQRCPNILALNQSQNTRHSETRPRICGHLFLIFPSEGMQL